MAIKTYEEMQDEVINLAGDSSTAMRNKIKTWLNDAQLDLALRLDIPSLSKNVTVTPDVSDGETGPDLPIDFLRELTVCILGADDKRWLNKITQREVDSTFPDLSQETASTPRYYLIRGQVYSTSDQIQYGMGFVPIQDKEYNVRVRYIMIPTDMSANGDYSPLGIEFNEALVYYASWWALKELRAQDWKDYKDAYINWRNEAEWRVKEGQNEGFRDIKSFYGPGY
jgi:hypothetical protein